VRWRLIALVQWLHDAFAVLLEEATVSRELKKPGFVKRNCLVLPSCPEAAALEAFKKISWGRAGWRRLSQGGLPALS
jgi:hypothetical protein